MPDPPANHIFNTPIDNLPVDSHSDAYIATIGGARKLHLDLGAQTDPSAADFYGIPYNLVRGSAMAWPTVAFYSSDPGLSWDPADFLDAVARDLASNEEVRHVHRRRRLGHVRQRHAGRRVAGHDG